MHVIHEEEGGSLALLSHGPCSSSSRAVGLRYVSDGVTARRTTTGAQ